MFGDKFYKRLAELQPWQQTGLRLALAERMPQLCAVYPGRRLRGCEGVSPRPGSDVELT